MATGVACYPASNPMTGIDANSQLPDRDRNPVASPSDTWTAAGHVADSQAWVCADRHNLAPSECETSHWKDRWMPLEFRLDRR